MNAACKYEFVPYFRVGRERRQSGKGGDGLGNSQFSLRTLCRYTEINHGPEGASWAQRARGMAGGTSFHPEPRQNILLVAFRIVAVIVPLGGSLRLIAAETPHRIPYYIPHDLRRRPESYNPAVTHRQNSRPWSQNRLKQRWVSIIREARKN